MVTPGNLEDDLKILGLPADASIIDARKAYRSLAKKNHPDRFADDAQILKGYCRYIPKATGHSTRKKN
jgi:curved DNA-binding protein CbpA